MGVTIITPEQYQAYLRKKSVGNGQRRESFIVPDYYWAAARIPAPRLEYRFHAIRRWRFDVAWPEKKVACEWEGGIWSKGRHVRGSGYLKDMEKYRAAAMAGWRVLRYWPGKNCKGIDFEQIRKALKE